MLLALAMLWGGSFLFAEVALEALSPLAVTAHRVTWSAVLLYVILRLRGLHLPKGATAWRGFFVMGLLNNALPFSLIFWGQTHIEAGLAAILNASTGVIGAVVAGVLLRDEPLSPNKLGGAVLGLCGVAIVIGPNALASLDPRSLGQMAVLGAALSYSLASVWARKQLSGNPPLVNAFGMLATAAVIMVPGVLLVEGGSPMVLPLRIWGALAGLSLLSTVVAFVLYFAILARAGAANLLLVTLMIPPFAISFGALFLGERLAPTVYLGLAVIALGLLVTDGRILRRLSPRDRVH